MRIVSPTLYLSQPQRQMMTRNFVRYLTRAQGVANGYNPAGVIGAAAAADQTVDTWFGALNQARATRLKNNLGLMIRCLNNYHVNGRSYERTIQLQHSSGDDTHDRTIMGQAFAFGVANPNAHFTLRIMVGLGFRDATYDDKVQTILHELSHRILATDDEVNAVCLSDDNECYGPADCRALAAADSDQALNNADSFGYFVCACNGLNPS